jgi:predicted  nucleic acid-binding Zn-ribbon protein
MPISVKLGKIRLTMNFHSFTQVILLSISCLALTSCKETQNLKQQLTDTTTRIKALHDESTTMNSQMVELRKFLPATINSEAMIKEFTTQLAGSIVGIENDISRTKASLQEAESQLSQAHKDLESLRAMAAQ